MKYIIMCAILLYLLSGCTAIGSKKYEETPTTNNDNVNKIVEVIEVGQKINFKNSFILKSKPEPTIADPIYNIVTGNEYSVKSKDRIYLEISSDSNSGWIPEWYIYNDGNVINTEGNKVLLIEKKTNLYLVPELSDEFTDALTLEKGQVVKIIREYSDWYNVEFVHYEAMNPGERWIKKESTTLYDLKKCKEGRIKVGSIIYNNDFSIFKDEENDDGTVMINSIANNPDTNEVFYEVTGPGGFYGLIKESDFLPNPFNDGKSR